MTRQTFDLEPYRQTPRRQGRKTPEFVVLTPLKEWIYNVWGPEAYVRVYGHPRHSPETFQLADGRVVHRNERRSCEARKAPLELDHAPSHTTPDAPVESGGSGLPDHSRPASETPATASRMPFSQLLPKNARKTGWSSQAPNDGCKNM